MIGRAVRYARRRARGVARCARGVDDYYVRELVQDALADTVLGVIAWDPARTALEQHVLDVVRSRTRHHRQRAARVRHVSDDALIEYPAATEPPDDPAGRLPSAVARLRRAAGADRVVAEIADAYDAGALTKGEVIAATGLTAAAYHNARIRITRLMRRRSTIS